MTRRFRTMAVAAVLLLGVSGPVAASAADSPPQADDALSDAVSSHAVAGHIDGKQVTPRSTEPVLLTDSVSMYPRGVRLQHNGDANGRIVASVTTFTDRGGEAAIFSSDDDGGSFEQIASVPVSQFNGQRGLCCGTLYELPQQVGGSA